MLIVQKWDFTNHEYNEVKINEAWYTPLYSSDMGETINCINCGKEMEVGDGYTSKQYHNQVGLGYSVCDSCYNDELSEERQND